MTKIGFGTWAWGNKFLWGYQPEKDDEILEATFKAAIDNGLELIDTADSYGIGKLNGRSEELIGKYMKKLPTKQRKNITIATKLAPYPWRIGRKGFVKAFRASETRLGRKVNRVQLHWSTYRYAPWQEIQLIDGLCDLFENELISEIGLSNMGPNRIRLIHSRLQARGIPLKSVQIQFSLLAPNPKKYFEIQKICKNLNIDLLAYSPLALGILTKSPEDTKPKGTYLRRNIFRQLLPSSKNIRTKLKEIAIRHNASQAQVALNWCRSNGAIPLPGIRNPLQALDVASSIKWDLSKEETNELNSLSLNCPTRMPSNPFQSN